MSQRVVKKECKSCGKVLTAQSQVNMLDKIERHIDDCHPGFKTVKNDFNKDY